MNDPKLELLPPGKMEITPELVSKFAGFVSEGVEAWVKAGRMLIQMVERNPNTYAIIMKECPQISIDTLLAFERIGRNEVNPYLLIENCPAQKKLLALPFDLQNQCYREKIGVLTGWHQDKPIVKKKFAIHMTDKEARIVFSPTGIRTIEEQCRISPCVNNRNKTGSKHMHDEKSAFEPQGFYRMVQSKAGIPQLEKVTEKMSEDYVRNAMRIDILPNGSELIQVFMLKAMAKHDEPEQDRKLLSGAAGSLITKPRTLADSANEQAELLEKEIAKKERDWERLDASSEKGKALRLEIQTLVKKLKMMQILKQ